MRRFLLLLALLFAPALAYAQNQLPAVQNSTGYVIATPTAPIGYNTVTGAVCVVGTASTCALSVANPYITVIASTADEASHVLKSSAGNLYRLAVHSGAAAGHVMVFDATSAPADGAVTPKVCRHVAANATVDIAFNYPSRFATGIVAVFSTTGCFTKTASATAYFEGYVQ